MDIVCVNTLQILQIFQVQYFEKLIIIFSYSQFSLHDFHKKVSQQVFTIISLILFFFFFSLQI